MTEGEQVGCDGPGHAWQQLRLEKQREQAAHPRDGYRIFLKVGALYFRLQGVAGKFKKKE